jgi:hypothetical protein
MPGCGGARVDPATPEALADHVAYLAAPDRQGRADGTAEADSAALYIESAFRELGLQPGAGDGGYRQTYAAATGVRVQGVIGMRDLRRGYQFNTDYTPLGFSSDGHDTTSLVFVGYAASAPQSGYDDFEGVDLSGKIALALLGEPADGDPSGPFEGAATTLHSDLYRKARLAREHGAVGLLLSPPAGGGEEDGVWKVSRDVAFRDAGLMVCQVTRAAAQALVEPFGMDLSALQQEIDRERKPRSKEIPGSKVELMVRMRRLPVELSNIVAKIPGRGAGSVVVLANYDGPGMGPDNSHRVLHPGANDNASGVAALIGVAGALRSAPRPERTVYFAAVSGEHLGSLGSESLMTDDVVPRDPTPLVIRLSRLGGAADTLLHVCASEQVASDQLRTLRELAADPGSGIVLGPKEGAAGACARLPGPWSGGAPCLLVTGAFDPDCLTPRDTPEKVDGQALSRNARRIEKIVQALAG